MPTRVDGVGALYFTEPGQVADIDLGQVLDQHGNAIVDLDDNIADLVDIIQQADTADDIGLGILLDDIAADIDIAFADGVVNVQGGDAQVGKHHRVDLYLVSLDHSAETHDVRYAGNGAELAVNDPVLDRLELTRVPEAAFQGIAVNFAGGSGGRLHVGVHVFRQVCVMQEIVDLLARVSILDAIFKDKLDNGEAKDRRGAKTGLALNGVHGQFDRDGDKFLHFFGAPSRPLCNDCYFGVGDIGKGLDRHGLESVHAIRGQQEGSEKNEVLILKGESQNPFHYSIHIVCWK